MRVNIALVKLELSVNKNLFFPFTKTPGLAECGVYFLKKAVVKNQKQMLDQSLPVIGITHFYYKQYNQP